MFFSPDPYVQAPHKWLNYNRYSYAWNNPLTYTDPTGKQNRGGLQNWHDHDHSTGSFNFMRDQIPGMTRGSAWSSHLPSEYSNNHMGFPSVVFGGDNLSGSMSGSMVSVGSRQSFMMGAGNFMQIVSGDDFRWIVEHGGEDWTFIEDLTILLPEVSISRRRRSVTAVPIFVSFGSASSNILSVTGRAIQDPTFFREMQRQSTVGASYVSEMRRMATIGGWTRFVGYAGGLVVGAGEIGFGMYQDGWDFGHNAQLAAARTVGGWAGAKAGAKGGAALGGWLTAPFGGWGAIPGSIIFGIAGGFGASWLSGTTYNHIFKIR